MARSMRSLSGTDDAHIGISFGDTSIISSTYFINTFFMSKLVDVSITYISET